MRKHHDPPPFLPKQKEGKIHAYVNNANDLKQCSKATKPFCTLHIILFLSLKDNKNPAKKKSAKKDNEMGITLLL